MPEVELKTSPELLLNPLLICRNEAEECLIETSINSLQISLKDIDEDISELKMFVNTRERLVATEFLKQFI